MKILDIQKERERLEELFKGADPAKKELAKGLLDQAAYLAVENAMLQEGMLETGMVKIHPVHKDIQKPIEAARQYRQNANSYAMMIKTISSILNTGGGEGEDPFDEWLRSKQQQMETDDE